MIIRGARHVFPCAPLFQVHNRAEAHLELNSLRRKNDCALIIKGDSLEVRTDGKLHLKFQEIVCIQD